MAVRITIELEESVYNFLVESFGLSVELVLQRILTSLVALTVTNPDALTDMLARASEVPEYRDTIERVMKPKEGQE